MKTFDILQGIIVLFILFILFKFSRGLGLIKTKKEKEVKQLPFTDYLLPAYWQQIKEQRGKASVIKMTQTLAYIARLKKAKTLRIVSTYLTNYVAEIFAVFAELKYKTQVSWLAYHYQQTTGKSLSADLVFMLPVDKLAELKSRLDKLPVTA